MRTLSFLLSPEKGLLTMGKDRHGEEGGKALQLLPTNGPWGRISYWPYSSLAKNPLPHTKGGGVWQFWLL